MQYYVILDRAITQSTVPLLTPIGVILFNMRSTWTVYLHGRSWWNWWGPSDSIWHHRAQSTLVNVMDCRLFKDKPLTDQMLNYCQSDHRYNLQQNLNRCMKIFFKEMHLKMSSTKCQPFCSDLNASKNNMLRVTKKNTVFFYSLLHHLIAITGFYDFLCLSKLEFQLLSLMMS